MARGQNRVRADGKRSRPKKNERTSARLTVRLPIVGEVPLLDLGDGRHTYDPDFRPALPPGAVAGDIRRQIYCCDAPRYAYIDVHRTCLQCGEPFVFGAAEQKYWYETLQFRLDSSAIRCLACRRLRRSDKAIKLRYQSAVQHAESSDANALIELAESLVDMIERLGAGRPDDVVAAARRASRASAVWADPLYWEGRGQELAGRDGRARSAFDAFVNASRSRPATRRLVADARRRLQQAP